MTWLKSYAVNVMITQKSHQNLANIFKISIPQEVRNTYFKGAFCWLKILVIQFEMKQYGCFVGIKRNVTVRNGRSGSSNGHVKAQSFE